MFVCRACTRKASTNLLCRLPATKGRRTSPSRTFATSSISRQLSTSDYHNLSSDWGELDAVSETEERKQPVNHGDRAAQKQKALEKLKRATRKELQYTTDPYHIADNVAKKLEEKEFDKALMLTREASRDKQVVVSWNHLIAHEFKDQQFHAAIKLYNEVSSASLSIISSSLFLSIIFYCLQCPR